MRLFFFIVMMLISSLTLAYPDGQSTSISEVQEQRYKTMLSELRCLVCQNQSLADSNAPLAQDLKKEVYDQIKGGKTDEEIKTYLVSRYGEYILFKPNLTKTTFVLWLGPVIFLVGAFVILGLSIRRQKGCDSLN